MIKVKVRVSNNSRTPNYLRFTAAQHGAVAYVSGDVHALDYERTLDMIGSLLGVDVDQMRLDVSAEVIAVLNRLDGRLASDC